MAADQGGVTWAVFSLMLGSRNLSDMCLKIYFSDDYSVAEYIIFNTVLYFLCPVSDELQDKFSDARYLYAENIKSALTTLSLYINPTKDMVLALVLGAVFSIETSNPHQACVLITAAYQAAQALGYHTRQGGTTEGRVDLSNSGVIFWVIYCLEKSLSLRLGRCSIIQRYDISLPLPGDDQASPTAIMRYCKVTIQLSDLSARVYSSLYSLQSLNDTDQVRISKALELYEELKGIKRERESIKASRLMNPLNNVPLSLLPPKRTLLILKQHHTPNPWPKKETQE
ncbi:unnamed protein product [Clonostachys byssicola]|uniref:Xylanolytic transcriptional activator regulatory domain-containing protein n=1 Tax=Clonostachys byssicola TaxID=160290 RepID=A0A9N9UYX1_9HYPO|nr:unnamed protein product [Clonostachys byssicola]